MASASSERLVFTSSEDGIQLEGAVIRPATGQPHPVAVVWIHGLTGRFYAPPAIGIGRELASRGIMFVTGNNRGHDFGTLLRRAGGEQFLGGGAWERFDEAPHDIAAWIDLAIDEGCQAVALLGHSLGALKVGYYQAQRQDDRLAGLIAASAPRAAGQIEPALVRQAERMLLEGRGQDLLPWNTRSVGGGTMSAASYLNRVRTNNDVYGFVRPEPVIARVRCPLLACYGTAEPTVGGAAELAVIRANASGAARVDTRLFEGADHSYAGHETEIGTALADWVATLA